MTRAALAGKRASAPAAASAARLLCRRPSAARQRARADDRRPRSARAGAQFYELLDTFFLAARNKPTPFLHVYHHPATLLLVYVSMTEELGVQWLPVVINLFVHIIMYYYYGLQVRQVAHARLPMLRAARILAGRIP